MHMNSSPLNLLPLKKTPPVQKFRDRPILWATRKTAHAPNAYTSIFILQTKTTPLCKTISTAIIQHYVPHNTLTAISEKLSRKFWPGQPGVLNCPHSLWFLIPDLVPFFHTNFFSFLLIVALLQAPLLFLWMCFNVLICSFDGIYYLLLPGLATGHGNWRLILGTPCGCVAAMFCL